MTEAQMFYETTEENLCRFCKIRPRKGATCGHPDCVTESKRQAGLKGKHRWNETMFVARKEA